ncbi:MAG: hypothetical protein AMXMBFR61_23150 [Fimbriimonadales bacterium]
MLSVFGLIVATACLQQVTPAQESPLSKMHGRIALLPLDSRPACTQMPVMMGQIAGVSVLAPPEAMLGVFRTPGKCDELAVWLRETSRSGVDAIIVSADMLCYGGLVPSRTDAVSQAKAEQRLELLQAIRADRPDLPIYVFSTIMRTAPTATKDAAPWRMELAKYLYYQDQYRATGSKGAATKAREHLVKVPKGELEKYERTRERNAKVQRHLVRLLKEGAIDFLIFGQDDAEPYGPHRLERASLKALLEREGIAGKAMICGGIDQTACVLLARALVRAERLTPRIWVQWSSESGKAVVAPNEGQTTEQAVQMQVFGAGARPAASKDEADVVLSINSYGRSAEDLAEFQRTLRDDLAAGRLVALADLNLDAGGTADPALVRFLLESKLCGYLAGYAGWNTVSNTLGTALPQAIVYWLALRDPQLDPRARELSQRAFILQRLAGEYGYHNYIRPQAYAYLTNDLKGRKEEVHGEDLVLLTRFVAKHTAKMLESFFRIGFLGTKVASDGTNRWDILTELVDVSIDLPWPRAYEVRISFGFATSPIARSHSDAHEAEPGSEGEEDGTKTPS